MLVEEVVVESPGNLHHWEEVASEAFPYQALGQWEVDGPEGPLGGNHVIVAAVEGSRGSSSEA